MLGKTDQDLAFEALSKLSVEDDTIDYIEARQSILDSLSSSTLSGVWESASKYLRNSELESMALLLVKTDFQQHPTDAIKLFFNLLSSGKKIAPKSTA